MPGIKLTSVASTVWSMSSREIIEALIAWDRDPKVLAQMAKGRMRAKIPELEEALSGHFGAHHAVVCRQIIDHIDFLDRSIGALTEEVTTRLVPFEAAVAIVTSIPGISRTTAEVIVAETGADMSRFPTPGQLCAWAGVAPASYESAGKRRPAGTRHGAEWLRRALIEAARAAVAHEEQLLLGPVRAHRPTTRGEQGGRRGRELDAVHHLAPAQRLAPSTKIPEPTTSSVVTIQPSRRSDSHGGSRRSGSTST